MKRLRPALLLALALAAASACDEKKAAEEKGTGSGSAALKASPPPERVSPGPSGAGPDSIAALKGAGPAGSDSVGDGRALFDGSRRLPDDPSGAGAVYAGNGGSKRPPPYTGEGRKDTLRIAEPPPPGSPGGKDGAKGAGGGEGDAGLAGGAGGEGDGAKGGPDASAGLRLASDSGASDAKGKRQRFLLVGDSQTAGHFGRGLDELLRRDYPGALVETFGQGGSRPAWFVPGNPHSGWATWNSFFHYYEDDDPAKLTRSLMTTPGKTRKTPLIGTLLKPDTTVVLVALGSNNLTWSAHGKPIWDPDPIKQLAEAVQAHGAKCLWLSPADMKGPMVPVDASKPDGPKRRKLTDEQMKSLLERADKEIKALIAGKCDYIDKRLPYAGGDGVHLGEKRGREVAEAVLKEIEARVPGAVPPSI